MGGLRNSRASSAKPAVAESGAGILAAVSQKRSQAKCYLHHHIPSGMSFLFSLELSVCLPFLLNGRYSHREGLFPSLCPYLVLASCLFSLAHSSTVPGHTLPILPLCSHCSSVPSSLVSSHSHCAIQLSKADPFQWGISHSQRETKTP